MNACFVCRTDVYHFFHDPFSSYRMHGTVEWLPGQPLGNDRKSWSDELLGDLPNLYVYAANNPSGKFRCLCLASLSTILR
jgi:hypothetical protein